MIVGISGNTLDITEGSFVGYRRYFANETFVNEVSKAGGVPIVLPYSTDLAKEHVSIIDGLLLTGGSDVDSSLYNKATKIRGISVIERDLYELEMVRLATEKGIPILGICRGLQLINVAFGGTLKYIDNHYTKEGHFAKISSKLSPLIGPQVTVNSYHNMGIETLGKGLEVVAESNDGIIEGISHEKHDFILGLQWHPEILDMGIIFEEFCSQIRKRKNKEEYKIEKQSIC